MIEPVPHPHPKEGGASRRQTLRRGSPSPSSGSSTLCQVARDCNPHRQKAPPRGHCQAPQGRPALRTGTQSPAPFSQASAGWGFQGLLGGMALAEGTAGPGQPLAHKASLAPHTFNTPSLPLSSPTSTRGRGRARGVLRQGEGACGGGGLGVGGGGGRRILGGRGPGAGGGSGLILGWKFVDIRSLPGEIGRNQQPSPQSCPHPMGSELGCCWGLGEEPERLWWDPGFAPQMEPRSASVPPTLCLQHLGGPSSWAPVLRCGFRSHCLGHGACSVPAPPGPGGGQGTCPKLGPCFPATLPTACVRRDMDPGCEHPQCLLQG